MTEDLFDQILFGWGRKGGVEAVRRSDGLDEKQLEMWSARLEQYCRLTPTTIDYKTERPERAFSYFEFSDDMAAMLARFDSRDPARNTSHALVGRASALGRYAMVLPGWARWRSSNPGLPLDRISQDDWGDLMNDWADDALLYLNQNRPAMATLVREVLCSKEEYFTLLLVDRDISPLPLLKLAQGILDPVLSEPGKRFEWTYSTYEETDTDGRFSPKVDGSPRFLCIWALPSSGEAHHRQRIDLSHAVEDDSFGILATGLIVMYQKDPRRYRDIIGQLLANDRGKSRRIARLLQQRRLATIGGPRQDAEDEATRILPRVDHNGVQPGVSDEQSQSQVPAQPPGSHEPLGTTEPSGPTQPHLEQNQPAPPPDPGQYERSPVKRERRRTADSLLATLKKGQGIPRDEYNRCVAELDELWKEDNPYMLLRQKKLERDVKNLTVGASITGALLLLLAVWSLFSTSGEVAVPQPAVVVVTVTESPSAIPAVPPVTTTTTTSAAAKAPATSPKQR